MALTEVGVLWLNGPELKLVHAAVIASYDPDALEQDLLFELDRRLAVTAAPGNLKNVAFEMLVTARQEGWLRDLLVMFSESNYPAVKEIADRILVQHVPAPDASAASASLSISATEPHAATGLSDISAMVDPYLRHLIGQQQPFIDRSALRVHLKDLLSESPSRVLVITGERPCGKSYTWFFIKQPDLLGGMTPVLVDLSEWKNPSPPIEVMSSIALQLGLEEPKIDEHAQESAQARRLRDWLVGQLQQHDRDGRWLLVFDSLDHVGQRDETLQLIEFLAGAAIRQRLPGLRVILLGYANRLAIDPLESVLTEEIRDIGEPELRDFFRLLAQHAKLPINDQAIDLAVHGVLSLLPDERERKLRQLPKAVREVGNAAFGRRVLQ
jgi:Effector-associated domain 1